MTERIDETGFGTIRLIQDTDEFCYGMDAVLLAAYADLQHTDVVMDLGSGNGIVAFLLEHKYHPARITGLELQPRPRELALRSLALNGLQDRIEFLQGDAKEVASRFAAESFSAVVCNPPYTEAGAGPTGSRSIRHAARHETTASLADFLAAASYLLKTQGSLTMVHRPKRLAEILSACRDVRLEPKRLRLVHPKEGSEANLVLLRCVKGARKGLVCDPPLIVRGPDGAYTAELRAIYERAE